MTMMTLNDARIDARARAHDAQNGLFARIVEAVRGYLDRMETRAQLERLSERELADIGLCRADIDDLVNPRA